MYWKPNICKLHKPCIRNIIFDLGNTLVYFDFSYFYNGIAEREKKLSGLKFKKYIYDNKLDVKLMTGRMSHREFFRKVKKKFDLKIGYGDFMFFYADIFWANQNMKRFLEKISRIKKYKLFLLSNTDSVHITFIDNNFPFVRLLKKRVLSYKVNMIKPHKKLFKYTLEKFHLKPEETVLVDDMKDNIISAQALGIKTIHYNLHKKFTSEFSRLVKGIS
ncbi:MAG: HAD family phosphatase [Ignavibacteriota bacterium]